MRVVRIHLRITIARIDRPRFDGRPRPPRIARYIDAVLVVPVAVDRRNTNPLTIEQSRLERELGPVPGQDRHRFGGVVRPSDGRSILGSAQQLPASHTCEIQTRRRVRAIPVAALSRQVLLETVAEEIGVRGIADHCVAVDRGDAGVGRQAEVDPLQGVGVVRGHPGFGRMPTQAIWWARVELVFDHLCPRHHQLTVVDLATHGPEPCRQRCGPGAHFEWLRSGRRTAVQERETRTVLK